MIAVAGGTADVAVGVVEAMEAPQPMEAMLGAMGPVLEKIPGEQGGEGGGPFHGWG